MRWLLLLRLLLLLLLRRRRRLLLQQMRQGCLSLLRSQASLILLHAL